MSDQTKQPVTQGTPQPAHLYRYFDNEEHAEALVRHGKVWISTLGWCRSSEAGRRLDSDEATLRLSVSSYSALDKSDRAKKIASNASQFGFDLGWVGKGTIFENNQFEISLPDAFLFCTSESPPTPYLLRAFGKFCVRIDRPGLFMREVTSAMKVRMSLVDFDWAPLSYGSRHLYDDDQLPPHPVFHGPAGNAEERESRMLWIPELSGTLERFELDVPSVAGLCRRI